MRHPFITARLLRQARAAIHAEASDQPAWETVLGRRVRRLLLWSAATLLVAALVALGVLLPVGAANARVADERGEQAVERSLAREHHAVPAPANQAAKAAQQTLARDTTPSPPPPASRPSAHRRPRRAGSARS